ncbi:Hypothetical protein RG1141_CH01540 [Neorhizobium galegae bv. officinalis bv. officinalis str. HAMBI 1141]|uniref:Uncharacterized protein n=1 Tax=Neorhizobium galegae bv. officinalis bv. officinalis str. HAMBI 1141 TaxID=1028801 RepID=A0A068T341_NEOGA|nr:hypothetical protein [Neorhizobium galegae]CDN52519.1 Hypothetical protein RG1141_CH01540 [Neorhizobium galegae bv. officinalis bv. officinalis str. HAMBI 1141]
MIFRTFPEERISSGGISAVAYRIDCSGCPAVGFYPQKRGGVPRPPPAITEHFRGMNWIVGSSPRKDLCPACAKRRKPRKEKSMDQTVKATRPVAEPPRECTREDRRIIMEKLDEVYGKDAYKAPWTDNAVAKDLGVPRDWVLKLREEFFGPAGSNPLFDEYLEKQAALAAQASTVCDLAKRADVAASDCRKAWEDMVPKLDELRLLSKRIEREIGR